jgi:DNA-binding PadR family transcriptional regulator
MSLLDYYVLLALVESPRYGYAIKDSVATESGGALKPLAGTLYRVIARLMADGLVKEATPPGEPEPHPGHARRYYALTAGGRRALAAETLQLKRATQLAERRLGAPLGSTGRR